MHDMLCGFACQLVRLVALVMVVILVASDAPAALVSAPDRSPDHHAIAATRTAQARQVVAATPLAFVPNEGRYDPAVAYTMHGRDTTLFFTPQGIRYRLRAAPMNALLSNTDVEQRPRSPEAVWSLALDFLGADPTVRPQALHPTLTRYSFFRGTASAWRTNIPAFSTLRYHNLWPGIDLMYTSAPTGVKYAFLVQPGADPQRIQLAYRGATAVAKSPDGSLLIGAGTRHLVDAAPVAYQQDGGRQMPIAATYAVDDATRDGHHAYHFQLSSYDRHRPLVIDPALLLSAGFIGGNGFDEVNAVATDRAGNMFVAGTTSSDIETFPVTVGPSTLRYGNDDAFVAKVKADGSALLYAGYLSSGGNDRAYAIAVDDAGNAYVAGRTQESQDAFPVTVGPDLTYNGGLTDAFIVKVTPDGTRLAYAGYVGGAGNDEAFGVGVDGQQRAALTGETSSDEASFPVTVGPDLSFNGGGTDAFVAGVAADGARFAYAGYVGGSAPEYPIGVTMDAAGNAYLTGSTGSDERSFPVKGGPSLTKNTGLDAYLVKVQAGGASLGFAGYVGGADEDGGRAVAIGGDGSIYLTGYTYSPETSFPVTVGPDLSFNGFADTFVMQLSPDARTVRYAGYIGGDNLDYSLGLAVDAQGVAYVAGTAFSKPATFPLTGPPIAPQPQDNVPDGFLALVRPRGEGLLYASFFPDAPALSGVAVDPRGDIAIAGSAFGTGAFPGVVGPDLSFNGLRDGFVAKLALVPELDIAIAAPAAVAPGAPLTYTIAVANRDTIGVAASDVVVSSTLSANLSPTNLTTSAGTCAVRSGGVSCAFGTIAAGKTVTVTFVVVPRVVGLLQNEARVTGNEREVDGANNRTVASTRVGGSAFLPLVRR